MDRNTENPYVLNLVLLGTGQHHLHKKRLNILTELPAHINTGANQFVHLIDGLGGMPPDKHPQKNLHPMIGSYYATANYNASENKIEVTKTPKPFLKSKSKMSGLLKGKGFHSTIAEAVKIVETLLAEGKGPLTVNLFGFSRGADSALRICNVLYGMYGKDVVKANVFAIDPVPGLGRRSAKKARLIPENVEEYQSILVEHENRAGFEPQDKSRLVIQNPSLTTVSHQILAGIHITPTRFDGNPKLPFLPNSKDATTDTPRLTWDALHQFARRHGTDMTNIEYLQKVKVDKEVKFELHPSAALTDEDKLAAYTRMRANVKSYERLVPLSKKINERGLLSSKSDYFLHGINYFQDKEHLRLFAARFPAFFDYFFQHNRDKASQSEVFANIAVMEKIPGMYQSLEKIVKDLPLINANPHLLENQKPTGINLSLKELSGELSELLERIISITNAVKTGQDDSTSLETAQALKQKTHALLIADESPEQKILAIHALIHTTVKQSSEPENAFNRKLSLIIPSLQQTASFAAHIEKDFPAKKITPRSSLFFSSSQTMSDYNVKIGKLLIDFLKDLAAINLGNDKESIHAGLQEALLKTRSYITANKNADQSLDKKIRIYLVETSTYPVTAKSVEDKLKVTVLREKLASDLNKITGPKTEFFIPQTRPRSGYNSAD